MIIGAVALVSVGGLAPVAQASSTSITPGTPVHVRLAAKASQSFTVPVSATQTLAADTTLSTPIDYQLFLSGNVQYSHGTIGFAKETGTDWSDLVAGSYTLDLTARDTPVEFDLTLRVLDLPASSVNAGEPVTQAFTTARQNVVRTVRAEAGQHIGLQINSASLTGVSAAAMFTVGVEVQIAAPGVGPYQGKFLATVEDGRAPAYLELTGNVPVTGTYSILFDPRNDTTGSISFTPIVVSDIVRTATLGTSQSMDTTTSGQNQVVRFKGAVGYRPVLRVTKVAMTSVNAPGQPPLVDYADYWVRDPEGTLFEQLHREEILTTYQAFNKNGVWAVVIDPTGDYVGHIEYTLTLVKDVVYKPKAGAKVKVSLSMPGQNALVEMNLKKGQRLVIRTAGARWTVTPPDLLIVGPKGEVYTFDEVKEYVETAPVLNTGLYLLYMDPYAASTGYETLSWSPGKNVVRPINVGTHFVVTTTTPGENDRLTFTGTAGKRFSLRVFQQSWTAVSGSNTAQVRLLDPAGKTVWSAAVPATGGTLTGPTLSRDGKWSVVIDPDHDSVGSITATPALK